MLRNSRAITPRNNVLGDAFWHLVGTVRLSSRSSAPARPLSSAPAPAASTQKADSLAHPLVFVRRLRSPYGGGCRPTARSRRRRGGSLPRLRLQGPGGASGRADRAGRMQCTGCSCFRSAQEERERGERPVLLLAQLLGARAACRTFRPLLRPLEGRRGSPRRLVDAVSSRTRVNRKDGEGGRGGRVIAPRLRRVGVTTPRRSPLVLPISLVSAPSSQLQRPASPPPTHTTRPRP